MTDLNKLRALAGVPVDLSKVDNAKATIRIPERVLKLTGQKLTEAAKVPQHRGELSPKTKKNMRERMKHAKAALEALEMAKEALMSVPPVDYNEDIPDLIKQLHHALHGEDGTGGLNHLHRTFSREFEDMNFPEDLENTEPGKDGNDSEAEIAAKEKEAAQKKAKNEKKRAEKEKQAEKEGTKKPVKEGQAVDNVLGSANTDLDSIESTAGEMEGEGSNTADNPAEQEETINPNLRKAVTGSKAVRNRNLKSPFEFQDKDRFNQDPNQFVNHKGRRDYEWEQHLKGEQEEDSDEEDCAMTMGEAAGLNTTGSGIATKPLMKPADSKMVTKGKSMDKQFADDADEKDGVEKPLATDGTEPNNVRKSKQGDLYYPKTQSHDEGPNQMTTNPYNDHQKVSVPESVKRGLREQIKLARDEAKQFEIRRDWDAKNFYEDMANAFEDLEGKLNKGTIYGLKEAQILMTSMMNLFTSKIPPDVVKFIAGGGVAKPLKDYLKQVTDAKV